MTAHWFLNAPESIESPLPTTRDRFDNHTCICTRQMIFHENATRDSSAALTNDKPIDREFDFSDTPWTAGDVRHFDRKQEARHDRHCSLWNARRPSCGLCRMWRGAWFHYCTYASGTAVWSSFERALDYLSFQRAD